MKKQDYVPEVNENAEFSDSQVGLDARKEYVVFISNSSDNSLARGADNKNMIVAACLKSRYEDEEHPVGARDFITATVGSRALKDAGIVTAAQKKAAMKEHVAFNLSYKLGDERETDEVDESTGEKRKYRQKIWMSSVVRFDEEG